MAKNKKEKGKKDHLIEGSIMLGIGVVFMLILVGAFGRAGKAITDFLVGSFGYAVYAYFLALIIFGILALCKIERPKIGIFRLLSLVMFFAMVIALLHCVSSSQYMGDGYGQYLSNCYGKHNTAGGVIAGVFVYPLLFVNYLGVVIFALLALAMGGIFAFYDNIFANLLSRKNGQPAELTAFDGVGNGTDYEVVESGLLVEDASAEKSGTEEEKDSYVPLGETVTQKVDFGIFGNENGDLSTRYASLYSKDNSTKKQEPEQSNFTRAYDILYGSGKKEEEKVQDSEPQDAYDILYGKKDNEDEKPLDLEFGDKKDYMSWTNDYRRQQILDNSNSIKNDKKADSQIQDRQNKTEKFSLNNDKFEKQENSGLDSDDKNQNIFKNLANNTVYFDKPKADNDIKQDNLSKSNYEDFVKKNNEESGLLIDKLAGEDWLNEDFAEKKVQEDNLQKIQDNEDKSSFADIGNMPTEDKTATHREIDGFEHLLKRQKEQIENKDEETLQKRHNLTAREDIASDFGTEEIRRERIRKERSDKGGFHNSSKQQDLQENENSIKDIQFDKANLIGAEDLNQKTDSKQTEAVQVEKVSEEVKKEKVRVKLAPYKYPPIELLGDYECKPKAMEDFTDKIQILETTLSEFGIDAKVNRVVTGPTFTRLELVMPKGVSVKRVLNYVDDVAMCLEVKSVRFQVPIPGKNAFGVEIPNADRGKVGLKAVIQSDAFANSRSKIAFAVGQDCEGENFVADLAAMPHLLIAGATGAGKSVCLNSLIVSLLYKYTPDELKLLLVDPKQVELNMYNRIPHMLIPEAISDKTMALNMLDWAIEEMEARYTLFKDRRVQKITDYNAIIDPKKEEKLPYIVIIIDEVGDFMLVIKKELEERIQRLTQKARAAGIHLILATQRPSVDVITGVIKANLPARIAFAVTNFADSKTILDQGGAEKLLRYGDMIFSDGVQDPTRLQGTLVEGKEVNAICDYIRANNECYFDKDIEEFICNTQSNSNAGANAAQTTFGESTGEQDDLFVRALYHVVTTGAVSISKLQRKFGIGFPRAARLVDTMEELGYIASSKDNAKQKDIVIDMPTFLAKYGDAKLD